MEEGWLLFDGVLRLPISVVLCAALLQFVDRQRLQIQSLRYGTISVASLRSADAASLRSRGVICLCSLVLRLQQAQVAPSARERSSGVYNAERGCFGRIKGPFVVS